MARYFTGSMKRDGEKSRNLVCCEFLFVMFAHSATLQIMELEAAVKKYDKTGHVLEKEEDEEDRMLLWLYLITIVSIYVFVVHYARYSWLFGIM